MFGETPSAVSHLTFGHSSVSYDVTLEDRSLIVRMNADPKVFAKTSANLAALRTLGLPVSEIVASDLTKTRHPFAYMVVNKIPGRDLRDELGAVTPAQKERLAGQIVGFQRRVATLPPGRSFGYASIGETARFPHWQDLVMSEIHKDLPGDLEPPLDRLRNRVFGLASTFAPYLAQVTPTCFLDDLTTKNLIVRDGELQGLIDFDVVCYGDPLWTLGLTAAAIVADLSAEHLDYVDALCRAYGLDETGRRVARWYAALFALTFWPSASPEQKDRLRHALDGWLEPIEH